MKIKGKEVVGVAFAYDGCHKIYVVEDRKDIDEAFAYGYTILPLSVLKTTYDNSCSLRYISNWKMTVSYIKQGKKGDFKEEKGGE